jgi:hypothetical protein
MAKNPAFPFYAQDFLVDTMRWSRGMKSLHIDLLCESWINGRLQNDKGYPVGLNDEDRILWREIKHKWRLVDKMWINDKLEEVRAAKQKFIEKQSEKGRKSAEARKNPVQPVFNSGSTVVEPLEIEKEKEYLIPKKESDCELQTQQEVFDLIFTDQRFVEMLQMNHPGKDYERGFRECYLYFSNRPNPPNVLWLWREKLLTWLSNMKPEKQNGITTKNDRTEFNNNELAIIAAHARKASGT